MLLSPIDVDGPSPRRDVDLAKALPTGPVIDPPFMTSMAAAVQSAVLRIRSVGTWRDRSKMVVPKNCLTLCGNVAPTSGRYMDAMKATSVLHIIAAGCLGLSASDGWAHATISAEAEAYGWSDSAQSVPQTQMHFGPFRVVASDRVELNGSVTSRTPAQFGALLQAHPHIRQVDIIDCPGTDDDEANLALARMIRKAGITTYVPSGGSVRSGGVELFLAGVRRRADSAAEFAVHSWLDEDGMAPEDFGEDDPVNRTYIEYYREMGMTEEKARAFYALTNSVPHDDALYLKPQDIAAYLPLD